MATNQGGPMTPHADLVARLRERVKKHHGAYQAMELRKAHKQCRLLRAEIERLKAQAPPASEALIERLTDAVARLPERHELGDVRDAIAAALAAQAPPASDPPGQQPETAEALIQRWQHWCRKFGEAAADEDDDGDARMAQEQIWSVEADMLAYPLPASPQAETTKGDESNRVMPAIYIEPAYACLSCMRQGHTHAEACVTAPLHVECHVEPPCSICRGTRDRRGQSLCLACHAEYMRAWRKKQRAIVQLARTLIREGKATLPETTEGGASCSPR